MISGIESLHPNASTSLPLASFAHPLGYLVHRVSFSSTWSLLFFAGVAWWVFARHAFESWLSVHTALGFVLLLQSFLPFAILQMVFRLLIAKRA